MYSRFEYIVDLVYLYIVKLCGYGLRRYVYSVARGPSQPFIGLMLYFAHYTKHVSSLSDVKTLLRRETSLFIRLHDDVYQPVCL